MFHTSNTYMEAPLIDTAWSILEAANDLRDWGRLKPVGV